MRTHSTARAAGLVGLAGGSALGTICAMHIGLSFGWCLARVGVFLRYPAVKFDLDTR
jgi:hypothetical protein